MVQNTGKYILLVDKSFVFIGWAFINIEDIMDEEVKILLLNNMPVKEFLVFYGMALLGALVFLFTKIIMAIEKDSSTPREFSWKHTLRGFLKFIIAMIVLPWAVIWFEDYAPIFMKVLFTFPENGDSHLNIGLNAGSAFLMGMSIDALVHTLLKNKFKKFTP